VVLESLQSEKSFGQVAKAYGVHPNSVNKRKQEFIEKGADVFDPFFGTKEKHYGLGLNICDLMISRSYGDFIGKETA